MPCSSTRCPDHPPYVPFPLMAGLPLHQEGRGRAQQTRKRGPARQEWQPGQGTRMERMGERAHGRQRQQRGWPGQPRRYRVPGQPLLNRHQVGGVSRSPDGLFAQQERLLRPVCLCCSCLLVLLGAPFAHPLLSHPPAPPYADFTSPFDVDCPVRGWLVTALLPPSWRAPPGVRGAAPAQGGP